jgi:hypothetical protein
MKLRPYRTTEIHVLKPRVAAGKVRFCCWFQQSVVEGEIDSQLTFFSDEEWSHLQGYTYTKVRSCFHSERCRPSGMLIHRQNSYALRSKRRTGRRGAQSRGTGQQSKNPHCIT